jgi:hypothetical protein
MPRAAVMARIGIVAALLSAVLCLGCDRDSSATHAQEAAVRAFRRSSIDTWQVRTFPLARIQAETPTDVCWEADNPRLGAAIQFHGVPPPPGVLDDTLCLLQIELTRRTAGEFAKEQALTRELDEPTAKEKRWHWLAERHEMISRIEVGDQAFYRYDVECENGDIVSASAEVLTLRYAQEDDAIVRRIFGSIRCLTP